MSVLPSGGRGDRGWTRDSVLRLSFSRPLDSSTLDDQRVYVTRCNSRLDGEQATAFDSDACNTQVNGSLHLSGDRTAVFVPTGLEEDGLFDGDYWYQLELRGQPAPIRSLDAKDLYCQMAVPGVEGWDSYVQNLPSGSRVCYRAIAVNSLVDAGPPVVAISHPKDGSSICAGGRRRLGHGHGRYPGLLRPAGPVRSERH